MPVGEDRKSGLVIPAGEVTLLISALFKTFAPGLWLRSFSRLPDRVLRGGIEPEIVSHAGRGEPEIDGDYFFRTSAQIFCVIFLCSSTSASLNIGSSGGMYFTPGVMNSAGETMLNSFTSRR
jgi:hypothetical protein